MSTLFRPPNDIFKQNLKNESYKRLSKVSVEIYLTQFVGLELKLYEKYRD